MDLTEVITKENFDFKGGNTNFDKPLEMAFEQIEKYLYRD